MELEELRSSDFNHFGALVHKCQGPAAILGDIVEVHVPARADTDLEHMPRCFLGQPLPQAAQSHEFL